MIIARVALDVPLEGLFDYLVGPGTSVEVGRRVLVPFGRRRVVGIVAELAHGSLLPPERLKPVQQALEDAPPLPAEVLRLARFCSRYYHHPLGPVLLGTLPTRLRQARPLKPEPPAAWRITAAGLAAGTGLPRQGSAARALLEALRATGHIENEGMAGHPPAALRALRSRGWVEPVFAGAPDSATATAPGHDLRPEQSVALAAVEAALDRYSAWLLHGVTGSGKTEVYLRLIDRVIARGRQALVLVPEISLTPQLEGRFRARFPGARLATLHSGLAEAERARAWLAALRGEVQIVLGTRLAVFAPLPQLGLIVVDEEHDSSFKQQEGLRYSARDVAVFRAREAGVPVVLGSATPSLESLVNAQRSRYGWLRLAGRAVADAALPDVRLVDLRREQPKEGIATPVFEAVGARLARGEQSLVFINRRGFSPVLACPACGWMSGCPRCSARTVLHLRESRLRCHHCGHEDPVPRSCPSCGNQDLRPVGHGTQRVEDAIGRAFPEARVARVDRDSVRRRGAWENLLAEIAGGRIDILVGTQMLAKGHDFPRITLVAVLNADGALYSADFRAGERLFAQLMQVAGRAGRGAAPGEVLIQTAFPDHPLYQALVAHDFDGAAAHLLAERRQAGFPPYVFQALLRAEAGRIEDVMAFLSGARGTALATPDGVTVYEPVPAPMARLAGRERAQLLVQSGSRPKLQAFLTAWAPRLPEIAGSRVRWSLDVDPLEL